ncbi:MULTISPECIES: hypothetical protein [Gordonia]|uniref:Uncharacterized protein n=1 Tax=Gordonia sihwensis NBRC 108236 TaxID=1223544 RepID=L7LEY6_9ACTN|nr:hypothetical protein [Gordonia sihwensis]WFN93440.1 hypothetical protein P5P27_02380 [Gordonia sihwensis]GAC59306.1 hypothetical protein GSI01S_01_02720 [Gordonia sihwensis NBRC 108236]
MASIVFNGITYEQVEPAVFEAARELVEAISNGQGTGALISLTGPGDAGVDTWHRIYFTPGAPITFIE